jgi:hypothetical protein
LLRFRQPPKIDPSRDQSHTHPLVILLGSFIVTQFGTLSELAAVPLADAALFPAAILRLKSPPLSGFLPGRLLEKVNMGHGDPGGEQAPTWNQIPRLALLNPHCQMTLSERWRWSRLSKAKYELSFIFYGLEWGQAD